MSLYLEILAGSAAFAVLPLLVLFAMLLLHELAHALVARVVGFRIRAIEVGGGPPVLAWWFRNVLVTLSVAVSEGRVQVIYGGERWLRTRIAALALAGPATNVAAAAGVVLLRTTLAPELPWLVPGAILAMCAAVMMALQGFAPTRRGRYREQPSDVALVLAMLRARSAEIETILEDSRTQAIQWRYERAFLRGALDDAEVVIERALAEGSAGIVWLECRAFLHAARGDAQSSLDDLDAVEQRFPAWIEKQRPEARRNGVDVDRLVRDARAAFLVSRAFYLALTGDPDDLAQADKLLATRLSRGKAKTAQACAVIRTKALVRLCQGRAAAAEELLRSALWGTEPYWLRSLSMGYLARSCALQGKTQQARRWSRRARRLHPTSVLLDAVERRLSA